MEVFPRAREEYEKQRGTQSSFSVALRKLCGLFAQYVLSNKLRVGLLRAMGVSIGKDVFVGKYCIIDDTFPELISIEDEANISFGVTIVSHDASKNVVAPVVIKKGAFLGARAIVLPGVTIGEEAVVGAGSVVTRDVASSRVVAGVPAREIEKTEAGGKDN